MRKPTSLFPLSVLSIGAVLGACGGDPPSPTSVRSHITSDLGNVLRESAAAGDGASNMVPTGSFDLFSRMLGGSGGSATSSLVAQASKQLNTTAAPGGFDPDAIVEQLNTTIFTNENEVEAGVYAVPADLVCTKTAYDSSGHEITVLDADCAASWNKVGLRIRVEENGSTLTFLVQLGVAHDEPLEISLTHTSLAVSVDLDEAQDAAVSIASAFGERAPNAKLAGKATGKLTIVGTAHAKLSLSIDRPLAIAVAEDGADLAGADAFRVSSAAAHLFDVELDGSVGIGAFALGLGATTVHLPGDVSYDLDLPGATADVTLAANQPLRINHVGLGDRTTTLSKNGAVGLAIDLNPANGRAFDATVAFDATAGTETLTVSPKLDAQIMTNHAVLGDTASTYDVTRVQLDGTLRGKDGSDQVKLLTGSFSITTNPAQYGFSATPGQCVASKDVVDSTSGDSYTQWTAGACR